MKNTIKFLAIATFALVSLVSCETYKLKDPGMTAVSKIDGQYIAKAVNPSDPTDVTVFTVVITNTESNQSDRILITMIDNIKYTVSPYYLEAIRFDAAYDNASCTFNCQNSIASEPVTIPYNWYLEQGYYTYADTYGSLGDCKVTITDGVVVPNGATTATGYLTDSIEFNYKRDFVSGPYVGTSVEYKVTGIKNTGWGEDVAEYAAIVENYWFGD